MLSQTLRSLKENTLYHILSGALYVLRYYLTTGNREKMKRFVEKISV